MATTRRAFGQNVANRARRMGWVVNNHRDGGWKIQAPDGHVVQIHLTPSDVNADEHVMSELRKHGWDEAEKEYNRLSDEKRAERLLAAQEENQRRLDQAQKQADALAQAANGHSRVPESVLLSPAPFPKTFERVLVTPELAEKLLALNTANRQIRRNDVELWRNVIERGEFRYTHQGVAIDETGVLQDGQHRLTAVVESGIPVELQISIGMPVENFNAIDNGLRRNFRDVAYKLGLANPSKVGSAARLLIILDEYPRRSFADKVSNTEVANFLSSPYGDGETLIGEAVHQAVNEAQLHWQAYRINTGAATVGIYQLWRQLGRENPYVQEFLEGSRNGVELGPEDARLALRRVMLNPSNNHVRTSYNHLGLFIKAWNKFVKGDQVKVLSFRPRMEDLPRLILPS